MTPKLPSVESIILNLEGLGVRRGPMTTAAVRETIDKIRNEYKVTGDVTSDALTDDAIATMAQSTLQAWTAGSLKPVINGTGIVIHTNLGRSPIAREIFLETVDIVTGYSNLEYDLPARTRGSRTHHVADILLRLVPGAEAALVVNNNAAAVYLVLNEFAKGREVIVSRGELVEIGGGFRIPDVMAASDARLIEVGTTNKTRLSDYQKAVTSDTAMIFKAHHSNFRMVGFTADVSHAEIAALAKEKGLISVADLGSGLVVAPSGPAVTRSGDDSGNVLRALFADEPLVSEVISAGVDLVTFSGDKLLGGPQAGIILGRRDLIDRLAKNPMLRALRVDKVAIALLEATARRLLTGDVEHVEALRMIALSAKTINDRCNTMILSARDAGLPSSVLLSVIPMRSEIGGGSVPGRNMPSFGVAIEANGLSEVVVESRLRNANPPLLGRLVGGRFAIDLRTILPGQETTIITHLINEFGQV